jgi:hypothetical protein
MRLACLTVEEALGVQAGIDERLEQLERHLLGQAALVQLQLRTDHDDRTAGIVDALAEQVLTEAALLALEHVGQRLQRTLVGAGDDATATAVVEQGVDRLLQHALFVADDDVGRAQLDQALQAVVTVDDAAIQVVQVGGREAAAVQRHQRTQFRRDDRNDRQHHPLRTVARLLEVLTIFRRFITSSASCPTRCRTALRAGRRRSFSRFMAQHLCRRLRRRSRR